MSHLRAFFALVFLFGIFHSSEEAFAQVSASRAEDFHNSMGINVQLRNIYNPYGNLTLVANSLNYVGLKHLRDESPQNLDLVNRFTTLASQGFTFNFIIGSNPNQQMNTTWLQSQLSLIKQVTSAQPGSVVGLEGLNEPYNFPNYWNGVLTNNWSVVNQVQQAEYSAVKNDLALANIPLQAPSLYPTCFSGTAINYGASADLGNAHTYPAAAAQPAAALAKDFSDQRNILAIGKPVRTTEFGYSVTPSDHSYGVSETAQAKYLVNGLADAYKMGISRLYIYHLIEYGDVSNPQPWGANAIFFADGTPKQAARAIHNLNTVLADSGTNRSSFTPGALSYSLGGMPSTANSLLLQKSNGTFYLLLWNEVKSYDPATETNIAVAPVNVNVSLGTLAASINVYNTMTGTAPVQTFSNISALTVGVPDNVLILEINTSTTATPPSYLVSVSSPTSGATVSGVIQVKGTAPGMANVEIFSQSGVLLARVTPDSTGAFSASADTTRLANGVQDLTVDAWDSAAGTPATHFDQKIISVNVQNVAASPTLKIGARVKALQSTNVYRKANKSGLRCTQPAGALGTLTQGPVNSAGAIMWQVNYDSGCDGWSDQSNLSPQ